MFTWSCCMSRAYSIVPCWSRVVDLSIRCVAFPRNTANWQEKKISRDELSIFKTIIDPSTWANQLTLHQQLGLWYRHMKCKVIYMVMVGIIEIKKCEVKWTLLEWLVYRLAKRAPNVCVPNIHFNIKMCVLCSKWKKCYLHFLQTKTANYTDDSKFWYDQSFTEAGS